MQESANELDDQIRAKLGSVPIRHIRDIMRGKQREMSEPNKRHLASMDHRPHWNRRCAACSHDGYVKSVKFGLTTITCLSCRTEHSPAEETGSAWKKERGTADTITCIEKGKCYECGGTLFRDYDDKKDATGETLNCRACGKSYYNAF